jgi:hypothetical protein
VWGFEFTTKAATQQEDSAELLPSLCVVDLSPVAARARVLVYEISWAEELAERRLEVTAPFTLGYKSKSTMRAAHLSPEASWQNALITR